MNCGNWVFPHPHYPDFFHKPGRLRNESHAIGAVGLGFDSRVGQIGTVSPTARHRGDVFSELCCPGAKPRRCAPPLVTRFGVIPRA